MAAEQCGAGWEKSCDVRLRRRHRSSRITASARLCARGTMDINGELVRQGHVFAAGGLFASYSGLEREARSAKAGIWAGGEAERPSEFRAKVWDEAKRRAPDGCPIKGLVTGRERVYVLPWSPDYERGRIHVRDRGTLERLAWS